MKKIFMPLFLLLLSSPVLAGQNSSPSECLRMYQGYLDDQNISRSQVMKFVDKCMPSRRALSDEPLHRKLLQVIHDEKEIVTVRS